MSLLVVCNLLPAIKVALRVLEVHHGLRQEMKERLTIKNCPSCRKVKNKIKAVPADYIRNGLYDKLKTDVVIVQ